MRTFPSIMMALATSAQAATVDIAYPSIVDNDTPKQAGSSNTANIVIKMAQYQDEDNWNYYQSQLESNQDISSEQFAQSQLFTKDVFYISAAFGNATSQMYFLCIGDDGTYGGVCAFSGIQQYLGTYRFDGTNWKILGGWLDSAESNYDSAYDIFENVYNQDGIQYAGLYW